MGRNKLLPFPYFMIHTSFPMSTDPVVPATKEDIQMLMNEIGRLYDANAGWQNEMLEKQQGWKDEIKDHFDLVAENI